MRYTEATGIFVLPSTPREGKSREGQTKSSWIFTRVHLAMAAAFCRYPVAECADVVVGSGGKGVLQVSYGEPAPFLNKSSETVAFFLVFCRLLVVSAYGSMVTMIVWEFGPRWLAWVSLLLVTPLLVLTAFGLLVLVVGGVDAIVRRIKRAVK
jgi:hypothetical protein